MRERILIIWSRLTHRIGPLGWRQVALCALVVAFVVLTKVPAPVEETEVQAAVAEDPAVSFLEKVREDLGRLDVELNELAELKHCATPFYINWSEHIRALEARLGDAHQASGRREIQSRIDTLYGSLAYQKQHTHEACALYDAHMTETKNSMDRFAAIRKALAAVIARIKNPTLEDIMLRDPVPSRIWLGSVPNNCGSDSYPFVRVSGGHGSHRDFIRSHLSVVDGNVRVEEPPGEYEPPREYLSIDSGRLCQDHFAYRGVEEIGHYEVEFYDAKQRRGSWRNGWLSRRPSVAYLTVVARRLQRVADTECDTVVGGDVQRQRELFEIYLGEISAPEDRILARDMFANGMRRVNADRRACQPKSSVLETAFNRESDSRVAELLDSEEDEYGEEYRQKFHKAEWIGRQIMGYVSLQRTFLPDLSPDTLDDLHEKYEKEYFEIEAEKRAERREVERAIRQNAHAMELAHLEAETDLKEAEIKRKENIAVERIRAEGQVRAAKAGQKSFLRFLGESVVDTFLPKLAGGSDSASGGGSGGASGLPARQVQ